MKDIILVMDDDATYSKKFCNQAIKLYGKKYLFLAFTNFTSMRNYSNENKVESLIISDTFIEQLDDIKANSFYLLNEKNKKLKREGKKNYIYKLQNVKEILRIVDEDINKKNERKETAISGRSKLCVFYSPLYIKNKIEIIKKIAKVLSKKIKVLIVDLDELDNYKGNVGLSNIIFNYKENNLNIENLKKEITNEKEQDFVKSVTYPEDFNVINNIDLANIINEIRNMDYDYVFVNADMSYVKCQYISNDADNLFIMKDKDNDKFDKFKSYLKNENQIDYKKITEFDLSKVDKSYIIAFSKQCFES